LVLISLNARRHPDDCPGVSMLVSITSSFLRSAYSGSNIESRSSR
jgi:hypothetical protein